LKYFELPIYNWFEKRGITIPWNEKPHTDFAWGFQNIEKRGASCYTLSVV
jgi:hypothetical protein